MVEGWVEFVRRIRGVVLWGGIRIMHTGRSRALVVTVAVVVQLIVGDNVCAVDVDAQLILVVAVVQLMSVMIVV